MSTPEEQVNQHIREKRELLGAHGQVPDVPTHAEALAADREAYPEGQRG